MADVIQDYTWNLKKIYPSMAAFKKDFEEVKKMADAMENHKGFFTKSKENLLMLLKDR
ncbi:MAG: oligoendopeptidase F family protein, partial [Clostridiales bacterium]|nr:oligoendopeptidase F family protein [Clostridiales bacterium]